MASQPLPPGATTPEPLLDRDGERQTVDELLGCARRSEGAVVVLEGPAGIGKSSLLAALSSDGAAAGALVLRARSGELERGFPFAGVRQLLGQWLAIASPTERNAALDGAAALALSALGLHDDDQCPPQADPSFQALHGLYWLVANLAARTPLLLVLDDAHWADAPTLRFLAYLAVRIDELPILLIVATAPDAVQRDHNLHDSLTAGPNATVLRLEPLSESASAAVVRRSLPDADDGFCSRCHGLTAGNPLLVQELVRALRRDSSPEPEFAWEQLDATSVARAALRRLERLGPGAVGVARAVAVLEQRCTLARIARLAGLDSNETAGLVETLVHAELLNGGPPLAFVHPIVRSAVYDDLSSVVRADWHRRAAEMLIDEGASVELVAAHLLATEPVGDPRNVEMLARAADAAFSQGAPDLAARYIRRALSEPAPAEQHASLLHRLGVAGAHAHDPGATADLAAAVEASRDPQERARMSLSLADLLMIADHPAEAVPVLAASLAELSESDRESRLLVRAQMAIASGMGGNQPFSINRLSDLVPSSFAGETLGERAILALHALDVCLTGQPAEDAAILARRALRGELNLGGIGPVAAPLITAVNVLMMSDCFDEAEAHWAAALEQARASGSLAGVINALALRPFCLLARGSLREAEADAQQALDLAGQHGAHAMWFYSLAFLVDALVHRGRPDAAEALLREHPLPAELPDHLPVNVLLVRRGLASLALNDPSQALLDLLAGGERMARNGIATPAVAAWRSHAAFAHHLLGEDREGRRLAEEELALARRVGTPRSIGVALRTKGILTGGNAGIALLEQAVDVLASSQARLEHAQALIELGAAIRRSGSRTAARVPLRVGLQGADACGAEGLAERALNELQATGARPRRYAITGADALTPSERRVCEFAGRGLTNREIAQQLFITTRTVEVHLNHAFRKLDVNSRKQLGAALGGGTAGG